MENYKFEVKDDILYLHVSGDFFLAQTIRVADKENPYLWIITNNIEDQALLRYLPRLKGAKKLIDEIHEDFDTNPYGRRVPRGTRPFQKWDLSEVFLS